MAVCTVCRGGRGLLIRGQWGGGQCAVCMYEGGGLLVMAAVSVGGGGEWGRWCSMYVQ